MTERELRRKLSELGYSLHRGFVHHIGDGSLLYDCHGKKTFGYVVLNHRTNSYEWGCYDLYYDHLWSLKDVESFLKSIA